MTVYVCYYERGYEGCTEPLAVYDDPEHAAAWLAGAESGYRGTPKVLELDVR
jgi:hypothetical protein